jgi:uncharacterized protein YdiU (UPF0061 family)
MPFPFDNSYARLPDEFHARVLPTPVSQPRLLALNEKLAADLGLDPQALATADGIDMLAGNRLPPLAEPIAMAYSGHQFGHFNPQLGDGRAILLGEIVTPSGERRDIQLKGSGPTPFSRRGDGRAALGPVLREYIVSEAMQALGVPTTRSLAAVATGEFVFREEALPGAVLTRVAASHIRVGTFEFFATRGDKVGLQALADYVIARHDPELTDDSEKYEKLLEHIVTRQAKLVAQWMLIGFIHGVMNTDNMTVSGETIDYGPCAFMEAYHPATVFSFIDRQGRYAYANQPSIAQWNLARLAECLMLLFKDEATAPERANAALSSFKTHFQSAYLNGLRRKLGLFDPHDNDTDLFVDLFERMGANEADFTLTFRRLCASAEDPTADAGVATLFKDPSAFAGFAEHWRARLRQEGGEGHARARAMRRINPAYIPRNHRVEEAIVAALKDDLEPFHRLNRVLEKPYEEQSEYRDYMLPAQPEERVTQTFCGT